MKTLPETLLEKIAYLYCNWFTPVSFDGVVDYDCWIKCQDATGCKYNFAEALEQLGISKSITSPSCAEIVFTCCVGDKDKFQGVKS